MQLHLLVTPSMGDVPNDVSVLADFGSVFLHVDGQNGASVGGKHVAVEAPRESLIAWLKRFDGVWVGVGQPAQQQFEVRHIKEGA